MRKIHFLTLSAFLICQTLTAGPLSSDMTILLRRDTWSFSPQEIKTLNRLEVEVFHRMLTSLLKDATGYTTEILKSDINYGRLVKFHVDDLNDDGIAEVLVRIDVSGRGLIRDLSILSRKSGQYYYETIPAYGTTITLLHDKNPTLIVGSSPLFEMTRADPIQTFPVLYAWTGSRCKDVSRENRAYYEIHYLPALTNALSRCQEIKIPETGEAKRWLMIDTIGWARAIEKFNTMFPNTLVPPSEVKKLDNLMKAFSIKGNENAFLIKKFKEAQMLFGGQLRDR